MKKSLLVLLPLSLIAVSCGLTAPTLEQAPAAIAVNAPAKPQNEDLSTNFTIVKTDTSQEELNDNVISKKDFVVQENARVVISVPIELQRKEKNRELKNKLRNSNWRSNQVQNNRDLAESESLKLNQADVAFSTAEYFNKAEQEIEKSLLRKSFTVMDRSKFEAELRDRREKKSDKNNSKALDAEVSRLRKQNKNGLISDQDLIGEMEAAENRYAIDSSGSTREAGDNELVDISELIRAAQEGKNQADYILQVNSFDINPISDRQLYIAEQDEVQTLFTEHPGLIDAMYEKQVATITQPGFFGYLNAKLIDVKTGAIVWVGEHRVESQNVTDIRVKMTMSRQVSNDTNIQRLVSRFNTNVKKKHSELNYLSTSAHDKNIDKNEQARRVSTYNSSLAQYKQLISNVPELPEWQYSYSVAEPNITPNFPSEFELKQIQKTSNDSQKNHNAFLRLKDRLGRHQSKIAKMVSKELIATIPSAE
ncbi:hypothetical protein [Colwellia psychrerythraea]|uniref:Lipoprotein n=1 Tax=Colwellia psychrerythraea TaxID=28229 RepID=A0A099KMU3_COLPS|nr:hypothetical protein [Colwellia psychrerythraea]KGJ90973.1 hypothetical protein GAB14E_0637 [Colwellia psychrerythraea]